MPNLGIYCGKTLYFLFSLNEFFQEEGPSNKTGFETTKQEITYERKQKFKWSLTWLIPLCKFIKDQELSVKHNRYLLQKT